MGVITVGIDGSAGSDAALAWAIQEAQLRDSTLRLVHAYQLSPMLPGTVAAPGDAPEVTAEQTIDEAIERFDLDATTIERDAVLVPHGNAARALIDASKDAELLVVGSRGLGGFMGLLVGSVSQQCVAHARCPVLVIPGPDA